MSMKKNLNRYTISHDDDKKCSTDEEQNLKTMNVLKTFTRKNNWQKMSNMPIGDGAEIKSPLLSAILKKPDFNLPQEENNSSSYSGSSKKEWQTTSKRLASAFAHEQNNETFTPVRHSKLSFNKKPIDQNDNHLEKTSNSLLHANQMNYLTFFGLGMGLLVSKLLKYLLVYIDWLLRQIKHLRDVFIGNGNIMDFFNFDDNSRYDLRIKLLIMPVVAICCLLYLIVALLHYGIRILLTDVPAFLMAMLQKVYIEI